VGDLITSVRTAGLDVESMREQYAHTLRRWLDNLETHRAEVLALVGSELLLDRRPL
jgi:cyclopropane fatty-acyl-phospholipid synthase-like methyltransferase